MSRIGRMPITIPAGVTIKLDGNVVTVKGPKGELTREVAKALTIKIEENTLTVERPSDVKEHRSLHGLDPASALAAAWPALAALAGRGRLGR